MEIVFFLMLLVCVSSVSFHTRDSCPVDVVEWNKSKHHFNCSKTEFYHCLLDERSRSGEFCTRERPLRVQIDYCPIYNNFAETITTEYCNVSHRCPTESFSSNEVYKYPVCLEKDHGKHDRTAAISENPSSSSNIVNVIGAISGTVSVAVAVICIVCFVCRNRKRQITREQEEIPLLCCNEISFCKTSVFHEAVRAINNGAKVLCFHGRWKSGKTTTAKEVYLCVTERLPRIVENFYEFDIRSFVDSVIIEEPFLGNITIKTNLLVKIKDLCSNIGREVNNFIIFTFSEEMWRLLSNDMNQTLSELQQGELHDFCLNYENLTEGDRVQIFRSKFEHYNPNTPFKDVETEALKFRPVHVAYVETCTLLSRYRIFQTTPGPGHFFTRPLFYLKLHIEDMSQSKKYQFLMLVFLSLIERKVDVNELTKQGTLYDELCKSCNLSTKNVEPISMIPEEFVFREEKGNYVLEHDVIQRMVLVVFGAHHFDKLLKFHQWKSPPKWIKHGKTKSLRRDSEIEPTLYLSEDEWIRLDDSCTTTKTN